MCLVFFFFVIFSVVVRQGYPGAAKARKSSSFFKENSILLYVRLTIRWKNIVRSATETHDSASQVGTGSRGLLDMRTHNSSDQLG